MKTMTPEEQRVAIAEACGWERIHPPKWPEGMFYWRKGSCCADEERELPDYLDSLDAMHEAFLSLKTTDKIRFHIHLESIVKGAPDPKLGSDFDYKVSNATAAQRAESFLRTIGKWNTEALRLAGEEVGL